jgi:hypothetical protein
MPELDVDHSGDGICAVSGRCAVLQDFNAVDRCARDGIEIDKSLGAISGSERIRSDAPPID